eukprot:g71389.t1
MAGVCGSTATAQALLAAGAHIEAKDDKGYTALHMAGVCGSTATAQALLAAGAHIETKDNKGCTALFLAGGYGHTATAQALLAAGAHTEAKDKAEKAEEAAEKALEVERRKAQEAQQQLAQLQAELERLRTAEDKKKAKDPTDCAVCMERPVEAVFAPCGHRCCCAECATELRQGGQSCPICRAKIESVGSLLLFSITSTS